MKFLEFVVALNHRDWRGVEVETLIFPTILDIRRSDFPI